MRYGLLLRLLGNCRLPFLFFPYTPLSPFLCITEEPCADAFSQLAALEDAAAAVVHEGRSEYPPILRLEKTTVIPFLSSILPKCRADEE